MISLRSGLLEAYGRFENHCTCFFKQAEPTSYVTGNAGF